MYPTLGVALCCVFGSGGCGSASVWLLLCVVCMLVCVCMFMCVCMFVYVFICVCVCVCFEVGGYRTEEENVIPFCSCAHAPEFRSGTSVNDSKIVMS